MVRLHVSGTTQPVEVSLRHTAAAAFSAELQMPPALEITERDFTFEKLQGALPLVRMEGISHIIIESASPFFMLLSDRPAAECAVRRFCEELGADGLGLLFLEGEGSERRMTPLVFIPGSSTVFWENSCASGSAAVGMYLADQKAAAVSVLLHEPGGDLLVSSDRNAGLTRLRGRVRRLVQGVTIPA